MLVKNLTQKITGNFELMTPSELYQLNETFKLYFDRERLQRLLQSWPEKKANSYLSTLFNGASLKDCFQLAEIKPIIDELKEQLRPNEPNYTFIEENLEYFENILKKGYEYIVLDGQHRLDTMVKYFNNKINFKPEELIRFQVEGEKGTVDIAGKFEKLPEEIQNHLLHNIPLLVVKYKTGDLRELVRVFVTSNSMVAMSIHEKRILNYNKTNRWLIEVIRDDSNIQAMFKRMKSMNGEYVLESKGDTLWLAEMLMYVNNNKYEGYDHSVLDDVLGSYPKKNIVLTNPDYELTKKIMKVMADGCAAYHSPKLLNKFTKSSFYNLFYTISFILQKGNIWGKKFEIDGLYKIQDEKLFVTWFFDEELKRLKAPGTSITYKSPTGKSHKQINELSFLCHNRDQKHSGKTSIKGVGGSKHTFDSWARVMTLLTSLNDSLKVLERTGIISKLGSRTTMTRDEALVFLDVPLSKSDGINIDEITPVSKGGMRLPGQIQAIPAKQNRTMSDRIKAPIIRKLSRATASKKRKSTGK